MRGALPMILRDFMGILQEGRDVLESSETLNTNSDPFLPGKICFFPYSFKKKSIGCSDGR
jgi:hypothetical protein